MFKKLFLRKNKKDVESKKPYDVYGIYENNKANVSIQDNDMNKEGQNINKERETVNPNNNRIKVKLKEDNKETCQYADIDMNSLMYSSKILSGRAGSGKTFYLLRELIALSKENQDDKLIITFSDYNEYDKILELFEKEIIYVNENHADFFKENNLKDFKGKIITVGHIYQSMVEREDMLETLRAFTSNLLNNKDLNAYIILDDLYYLLEDDILDNVIAIISNPYIYKNYTINITSIEYKRDINVKIDNDYVPKLYFQTSDSHLYDYRNENPNNELEDYVDYIDQIKKGQHLLFRNRKVYYSFDTVHYIDITKSK